MTTCQSCGLMHGATILPLAGGSYVPLDPAEFTSGRPHTLNGMRIVVTAGLCQRCRWEQPAGQGGQLALGEVKA